MKFSHVSQSFTKIEQTSGRLEITQMLADLLRDATSTEARIIAYMSLGNLNPVYVGTQFNLAAKSMKGVLARILKISIEDAASLIKIAGDAGCALGKSEWDNKPSDELTVNQVYNKLQGIHDVSGTGSQEAKETLLVELINELDTTSAKYVIRIVIGKLRLGFSDMTLIDAFSWMKRGDKSLRKPLEHAYNISADIGNIVCVLKQEGVEAIEEMVITPGIPIRPAAAERLAHSKAIIEKIGECIAQPKLDGFRLQIHSWKENGEHKVAFYSRNLSDMSEMFPELYAAVQAMKQTDFVIEGEAIAYDPQTNTFLPFQETAKRRRKYGVEKKAEELPLQFIGFDLLYLKGRSYLDDTHVQRRKALAVLLDKLTPQVAKKLKLIEEKTFNDPKELEKYFHQNISGGLEGLVVKKPDAHYQPGKRNFNWIKLKRQETGHLDDTLDCVILGYYAGQGKRASFGIGALLVGIYNSKKDTFQTVAKIGTGLTDDQWREAKKQCDQIAVSDKPNDVECPKELTPDVWTYPEMVCQIRADDISLSPLHTAGKTKQNQGMALRFPRFMGYRSDKSAKDATTDRELASLYELQFDFDKKTTTLRS